MRMRSSILHGEGCELFTWPVRCSAAMFVGHTLKHCKGVLRLMIEECLEDLLCKIIIKLLL